MHKILSFLFCISFSSVFAQKEIQNIPVDFTYKTDKNVKMFAFNNLTKDTACVITMNGDEMRGFLLDNKHNVVKNFILPRKYNIQRVNEKFQIAGAYFNNNKIIIAESKNTEDFNLIIYEYDLKSGKNTSHEINMPVQKQMLCGIISVGDRILFATVDKKMPVIYVYEISDSINYAIKEFSLKENAGKKYKGSNLYESLTRVNGFSREANVGLFDDPNKVSTALLIKHNKLYYQNDTITITIDRLKETDLLIMDLKKQILNYKTIDHNSEYCAESSHSFITYNSTVLNGKLFSESVCIDALELTVSDIFSSKKINQFIVKNNDTINFKNTPVSEDKENPGSLNKSRNERELTRTKQLLKRMADGYGIISARYDSAGNIEVTIGALKANQNQSAFLVGGLLGYALTTMINNSFSFTLNWSSAIRFKSLFTPDNIQHVTGNVAVSIEEKIENYADGKKIAEKPNVIFSLSGKYFFAFYEHEKDNIVVVEL